MSRKHTRRRLPLRALLVASVVALALPSVAQGQTTGEDPERRDETKRLIEQLQELDVPVEDDQLDEPPPANGPHRGTPAVALQTLVTHLEGLVARQSDPGLDAALRHGRAALDAYNQGAPGDRPTHLTATLEAMAQALGALAAVEPASAPLERVEFGYASLARQIAAGILDRAIDAGVDRDTLRRARTALLAGDRLVARGDGAGGIGAFGTALETAGGGLHFDVDQFEQNIIDAFAGQSVGASYTISVNGLLARQDGLGSARTAEDPPATDQSPTKRMHIASVSKTITAVGALRLLEQNALSVDDPIAPWLPPEWDIGPGVDPDDGGEFLTFRDLLTHTSGIGEDVSSGYESLQERMFFGITQPKTFNYENANFGLFRIMVPYLLGIDPGSFSPDYPDAAIDVFGSAIFLQYLRDEILEPSGITSGACFPLDDTQTALYRFPYDDSDGWLTGNMIAGCGGYGLYLSTNDLGAFLATLRYTETLISAEMRSVMNSGYLGWMDPLNYSWADGDFGAYHTHGGDWGDGSDPKRGLDACVVNFPVAGVQAALLVNSVGGSYYEDVDFEEAGASAYQCEVLQQAYESAWIA